MTKNTFMGSSLALALAVLLSGSPASAASQDDLASVTPNGGQPGFEEAEGLVLATGATACFQLNNGAATWFVNARLDINAYPYTITGGNISGTICDSPAWDLTGGSVGANITINGTHVGAGACASTVTIVAPFGAPAGYTGTYGFNGASGTFTHRTLFLGFNRPTCP